MVFSRFFLGGGGVVSFLFDIFASPERGEMDPPLADQR